MPDLQKFVEAQEHSFFRALKEIRNGRKQSHWMWYVFPQIQGLGHSPAALRYAGWRKSAELHWKWNAVTRAFCLDTRMI